MYTGTKELISSLVDEEIEVQKSSSHKQNAEILVEQTILSSSMSDEVTVISRGCKTGEEYAMCRYADFHSDRITYIKWIEVDSSIRNNGVGTKIRQDMIRDINRNSRQTIYTDIIDERLIPVAKKQGFERITDGSSIDGWFVREGSKTVRFSSKD